LFRFLRFFVIVNSSSLVAHIAIAERETEQIPGSIRAAHRERHSQAQLPRSYQQRRA
jgi:hypothetical protein